MTDQTHPGPDISRSAAPARMVGLVRLGLGLAWGLAASALINMNHHWEFKGYEAWYVAGVAIVGVLPFVLLGSVGRLRLRTLAAWSLVALLIAGLYGAYDLWRSPNASGFNQTIRHSPSFAVVLIGGAWFFVAHHLIEPADAERTLWPSYRGRFESAWRNGFQIALSVAFAGFVYALLRLGGELFKVIGIKWLNDLLDNDWIYPGVLAVSFAVAIHHTDVRPGVIRSVRALALSLLSWALPVLTLVVTGFLVALVFTGLAPLWKAGSAVATMLAAAGLLVLLINAAYQDGRPEQPAIAPLRWSARVAAIALIPLTALAAYSIGLRIGQYGLSPERIWGIAAVVIAAAYALGYAWAAVARQGWMHRLERVNVFAAVLMLATGLLLCSPLLDPARLSVANQLDRLQHRRVAPAAFDFTALRFHDGRYGVQALKRLAASADPQIATRARIAQRLTNAYEQADADALRPAMSHATIHPAGARLPDGFTKGRWDHPATRCRRWTASKMVRPAI